MKSIFLGNPENIAKVYTPEIQEALQREAGLEPGRVYSPADIPEGSHTEYIFSTWGMPSMNSEEISCLLPNLKGVFYGAGTVQKFARPFLTGGIRVFSGWHANAVPVAEYTLAQILLGGKNFYQCARLQSAGMLDEAREAKSPIHGNYDITVGIIGAGVIGTMVIRLLQNHRINVLVFDPFLSAERAGELKVEVCSLERIFSECQVVSNHLANNAETRGMLDYNLFSKMPRWGVFINTGRGAQVVESDLVRALKERADLTAVLDVTDPEPPARGHDFYTLPNALLTPHIAGSIGHEVERLGEYMLEEFRRIRGGISPKFEVSLEMLKTMA